MIPLPISICCDCARNQAAADELLFESPIRPEMGLNVSPERVVGGVKRFPEFTTDVCLEGSMKATGFAGVV